MSEEVHGAIEDVPETSCGETVKYCCPEEFNQKEELCKMFVGGLVKDTTDDEFKVMFEKFGEIKDSVIIRKGESKSDRLFGFITFAKCDDLDDCLLGRPHKHKGRELDVKRAVPKGQTDENWHFKVKKLYLGNVPPVFDTSPLLKYLRSRHSPKLGTINEIDLLKAKDETGNLTEKNRGFGFISVSSEDIADRIAIAEMKLIFDGTALRISKAKPKGSEGQQRGGFKGKVQGGQQVSSSGWEDWGYGSYGGYGGYGGYGYGYGNGYGYGGYDYYGYPSYSGYAAPGRGGKYGKRYGPY